MLWTEAGDAEAEAETDPVAEEQAPAADADSSEAQSDEPEGEEGEAAVEHDGDVPEVHAEDGPDRSNGNRDDLGESRYARKGRRLPRIEDGDGNAQASGSGLRNAIISGNKRRGSS
jgi:hypothetical protein